MEIASKPAELSRREFLDVSLGAAALTVGSMGAGSAAEEAGELRKLAGARNVLFGAAAVSRVLNTDPAMAAIYAREAALIVPDYEMKWRAIRPAQSTYNFVAADELARFASQHGLRLRGHCLAWEESN